MEQGTWYYSEDGLTAVGPVSTDGMQGLLRSGRLPESALVWRPGFREWKTIESAADTVLGDTQSAPTRTDATPPPLPRLTR